MKIILGSSSKYRKQVLLEHGIDVDSMSPDIDEKAIRTHDFYQLPLILARAKAEALIPKITEPVILITSDQVVVCNGDLHEKPQDETEARLFLKKYSEGYPAETVSAIVVTNTASKKQVEGIDIAKVFHAPIPESIIEDFLLKGDPYSKAGGFSVRDPSLSKYVVKIDGTVDSVMGMPIV